MEIQKQKIENNFNQWKGSLEQVDDILVIGIELKEKTNNIILENTSLPKFIETIEISDENQNIVNIPIITTDIPNISNIPYAINKIDYKIDEYIRIENLQNNSQFYQAYDIVKQNSIYEQVYNSNIEMFHKFMENEINKIDKIIIDLNYQKYRKKILYIAIELFQRFYRESIPNAEIKFNLSKSDTDIYFQFQNFILSERVKKIENEIIELNEIAHDNEKLKSILREILKKAELKPKGGTYVGLLDIVRKTGNKLTYNLEEINNEISFFTLIVKINLNEKTDNTW